MHFLALHEPYSAPEHPVPINATIVHARTLLHPRLPQPDGGLMFRCLTEFPGRFPGCVVPLSTLTYELDGGALWPAIGDWERVADGVVLLSRQRLCDAMPLGLGPRATAVLGNGPYTNHTVYYVDGPPQTYGSEDRQAEIAAMTEHVKNFVARGPFRPGQGLTLPPREPEVLPYRPYDYSTR
ncbi:hypothetical protein AMES_8045 [Amycolatopsis mediterranei S699]|uniref:Uncharacterized protein n=2 Tax=Amycolatopsis mediterranei TaxID=33910 RepID=A0A0H3DG74_AMYMU|nr:hypothetical protein AMED_8170 [Amycolatopsis mediterranei U32]AEK46860.1 hypothetical protein RAM_41965 [Amycolatopsis mediterranei S699]AGT88707.1 hypothetical protein B737_8046 [Amycolatopsis mediterranei RB]KDO07881.1 hypothetical protein DV26_26710 [Amycolatopsis mediterranei]AFO81578.1 hypothetical protein AMES_8045 [Amycolatopsis mediterranei S699]